MSAPQVAAVIEETWAPEYTYVGVIIDMESVQKLQVCILSIAMVNINHTLSA